MDTVNSWYCAVWLEIMHSGHFPHKTTSLKLHQPDRQTTCWSCGEWGNLQSFVVVIKWINPFRLVSAISPICLLLHHMHATVQPPQKHTQENTTKEELKNMFTWAYEQIVFHWPTGTHMQHTQQQALAHHMCTFFNVDMLTQWPCPHMHENMHAWTNLWLVVGYYSQLSEQETCNLCTVLTQWGGVSDVWLQIQLCSGGI